MVALWTLTTHRCVQQFLDDRDGGPAGPEFDTRKPGFRRANFGLSLESL
jgi:hypothetical protein